MAENDVKRNQLNRRRRFQNDENLYRVLAESLHNIIFLQALNRFINLMLFISFLVFIHHFVSLTQKLIHGARV